MPIYEYRCHDCNEIFEYMQSISEPHKTICEKCRGTLERIISQSAFHLKGGGWYKDLYSSAKSSESGSNDAASSASSAKKSDSSSKTDSSKSSETKSTDSSSSSSS